MLGADHRGSVEKRPQGETKYQSRRIDEIPPPWSASVSLFLPVFLQLTVIVASRRSRRAALSLPPTELRQSLDLGQSPTGDMIEVGLAKA